MVRRRNRSEEGLGRENKVEALTVVQAGDDEAWAQGKMLGGGGRMLRETGSQGHFKIIKKTVRESEVSKMLGGTGSGD